MKILASLAALLSGLCVLPAIAAPPAVILGKAEVSGALDDHHAPGFAMKTLHRVDLSDAHSSLATLRRDQSETSGLSHDHVTEIYEILDGEATLLTGGTFKDGGKAMTSDADPAIGPSHQGVIEGGTSAVVTPGDLVVIAPGTPHEFSRIDGHVTYLVIRLSREKY
jgi:mannose-6-phosphate isomerase-like protein (cupin superfamily)